MNYFKRELYRAIKIKSAYDEVLSDKNMKLKMCKNLDSVKPPSRSTVYSTVMVQSGSHIHFGCVCV